MILMKLRAAIQEVLQQSAAEAGRQLPSDPDRRLLPALDLTYADWTSRHVE